MHLLASEQYINSIMHGATIEVTEKEILFMKGSYIAEVCDVSSVVPCRVVW